MTETERGERLSEKQEKEIVTVTVTVTLTVTDGDRETCGWKTRYEGFRNIGASFIFVRCAAIPLQKLAYFRNDTKWSLFTEFAWRSTSNFALSQGRRKWINGIHQWTLILYSPSPERYSPCLYVNSDPARISTNPWKGRHKGRISFRNMYIVRQSGGQKSPKTNRWSWNGKWKFMEIQLISFRSSFSFSR